MEDTSELQKDIQDFTQLPVNPDLVLKNAKLPTGRQKYLSQDDAVRMGIHTQRLGTFVNEVDNITASFDVPRNIFEAVMLASQIAPREIVSRLKITALPDISMPIIVTNGALRLNRKRVPAMVDLINTVPICIRMSVENIRISFGLPHNKKSVLDPVISFAVAVHEITDFIQLAEPTLGHDFIIPRNHVHEQMLAKGHKNSSSEHQSNKIASELTEKVFGVTITFGENDETLFTPEPTNK